MKGVEGRGELRSVHATDRLIRRVGVRTSIRQTAAEAEESLFSSKLEAGRGRLGSKHRLGVASTKGHNSYTLPSPNDIDAETNTRADETALRRSLN